MPTSIVPGFAPGARERSRRVENTELRPLGAGEILDRAVTLFVRQFVPIVIVLAIVLVPVMALQAISQPHSGRVFSDMAAIIRAGTDTAASREATKMMELDSGNGSLVVVVILGGIILQLLMLSAIIATVAAAYSGSRVSVAEAYRTGLRCWFPQLVVGLVFIVIAIIGMIPPFILYLLTIFVAAALAALHATIPAIVAGIVLGLIDIAAFAAVGAWAFMTYYAAAVAVVTETSNAVTAIGIAMRRGLARPMLLRMVVGGFIILAVSYAGIIPVIGIAATVTALTHVEVLYFVINGVGTVLLQGLVTVFVVVYAIDVRVRREGYDLALAAEPALPVA
ncbi:MAG: hypothetical protein JOZ86_00785 [Candidatus Eremiobacteraeota bacterium]|nr:hypothetical protein [Candidatus Eremiobacteraeota bacterium]